MVTTLLFKQLEPEGTLNHPSRRPRHSVFIADDRAHLRAIRVMAHPKFRVIKCQSTGSCVAVLCF